MIRGKILIFSLIFVLSTAAFFAPPVGARTIQKFVYDSNDERDPFVPLITGDTAKVTGLDNVQTVDDVILEGVMWDPAGRSIAVLNGVMLGDGDKVGVVEMVKIEEKRVTLLVNDVKYTLDLAVKGD